MAESVRLDSVLQVIREIGGLAQLEPEQDIYDAGFSSVQALPLLLEFEDRFGVTIPDERFVQARTALSVANLLAELQP